MARFIFRLIAALFLGVVVLSPSGCLPAEAASLGASATTAEAKIKQLVQNLSLNHEVDSDGDFMFSLTGIKIWISPRPVQVALDNGTTTYWVKVFSFAPKASSLTCARIMTSESEIGNVRIANTDGTRTKLAWRMLVPIDSDGDHVLAAIEAARDFVAKVVLLDL